MRKKKEIEVETNKMGKRKREEDFIQKIQTLSPEGLFALARALGVKFSRIRIRTKEGVDTGLTPIQLRDLYTREELKQLDYKVSMERKEATEILAEVLNEFSRSSFRDQKTILEAISKFEEESIKEVDKKIKDAENFYVEKFEENLKAEKIEKIEEPLQGALTSSDMVSANDGGELYGPRAEN